MARIEPLESPYSDEVRASFDKLMPKGMEPLSLFRTLAKNPRVLRRVQRGGLLDPGSISVRLRELCILRTCARCGADYEWGVHAKLFASSASLTEAELAATWSRTTSLETFTREDELVLALCDELHDTSTIGDTLWRALGEHFSEPQLIELLVLAGLYHAVSFVVNACGVASEPGPRMRRATTAET